MGNASKGLSKTQGQTTQQNRPLVFCVLRMCYIGLSTDKALYGLSPFFLPPLCALIRPLAPTHTPWFWILCWMFFSFLTHLWVYYIFNSFKCPLLLYNFLLFTLLFYLLSGNDNFLSEKREERKEKSEKNKKKRQPSVENCRFFLARPGGFEPTTYRFVAGHSIHWATGAFTKAYIYYHMNYVLSTLFLKNDYYFRK